MKKIMFVLLSILMPLLANGATTTFQVGGINYETLEEDNQAVKVTYGSTKYSGDIVIPATVTYGGKTYSVKKIGQGAFWECTGLKSIVLPEGLVEIENSSFTGCTGLKAITFPSTLISIQEYRYSGNTGAFERCTGLKSIYFPPTMKQPEAYTPNIGGVSFYGCTGLKTIYVAGSETAIGMYDVFGGCTAVTEFVSNIQNPRNIDVDGRSFQGFVETANLIVPDGKKTDYQNSDGWYLFRNIYEHSNYTKAFAIVTASRGGKVTYGSDDVSTGTQVWGIAKGQKATFTFTPDADHRLLKLLKDGSDVTSSVSNGQYTVSNVQSDFTLEAFFEEGTTPAPQPQTQDKGTANLSIESLEIKAGETKTMLIDMQNPDDQVTMVQFDLRLPDGLSIATGDDAVDIAGRTTWRNHTLTSKADNGLTRILLYSATNEVVDGTSGAIISIKLKASSTFKGGDVKLENQLMTTPSLVESKPSTYTYSIKGTETPAGDGEPYVVYNNGTLTFYCDNKRSSRQGTVYDLEQKRNGGPAWLENSNSVTKAIFDPSFANARPKTTASWFYKCSAMADIEGIAYLNTSNVSNMMLMFYFCSSLTSLDVSDFNTSNVTNMMDMFCACSGLKSLDVSKFNTSNVTNMSAMFHQCSGLTILDVSNFNTSNVTNMSMLFDRCSGLTSLDVSKFDTSNVTDIHQMFNRCSGLTSLNISNFNTSNVTDMSYMFSNCSGLTRLDVSNFNTSNVTNMWNMFGDCSNLTSLDLSNFNTSNVTDMGQMFSGCTKLTKLTLGNRFVTPEQTGCNNVFKYSNSLNTIAYTGDIPSSINSKFFEGVGTSSNPATLEVPAQYRDHYAVKFDGNKFFGGYFKLSGKTDTSEDYITFACPVAKSICIQNWDTDGDGKLSKTEAAAVTDLGKVFQKTDVTSLDELKYFTGLISIPKGCFWQCTKLRSVIIPANVSMLGSWLFQECHSLERIEVDVNNPNFESPEGCNAIITKGSRKELLYGCKNTLIPEGVTDIKYYAFAYNEGIESIHIPASVRNIDGQSFSLCPNLNTITVDPDNKYYDSRNDCNAIINTDTNQLIVGSNSTIIPEGVAGIGYYAFGGRLIKSIMLPQSVKTIGRLAFSVCYNLEEVRLSEGLESIGGYSFQSCESLNKINIPSTVVSIEEGAFNLAKGIEVIWSYIEKPFAVTNAFDSDCYKKATLYVPFGTKSTYETTEGWKNFKNIVEMDGSEPTDTKPYAVYNDFTLTFYCDDQRSKRSGAVYNLNEGEEDPDWVLDSNNRNVEKVVFDASFANARPTTTYRWFLSCDILREIVGIENLNTSEVKNMQNMFGFCEFLKSVDVSHFDTKLVQNMGGMFYYCTSLESIDVSHFDTNNVWSMASMFSQCKSLTEVNLSSFNTSKVEYLSRLFKGCSNLKTVYLGSGFVSDNNVEIEDIFADCQNLSKVVFTGDIPYSIHGTLFEGVGTASKPAMLDVPKQYIANYKAKFNGNMFYGGYFTLREAIVPDEKGDKDYGSGNSEIGEKTDLDGTVIGNVYYSIAPEHGGYNSAEGCLVVTQPSSDGGFDAEDPFGDDFKGMFTGIVIMVQPGTGTVKVEAETLGGMTLKVKVGNGLPIEMTLNSKSTLNIPYSVDRPTYVYIYAGGTSGVRSRAGSDAALKIYGISWESSASAITAPVGEERLYDVYSISGKLVKRRATSLDALPKGVYIVNGRKVVVK